MKRLLTPLALVFCVAVLASGCETPAGDAPAEDTAAPLNAEAQSALAALPSEARFLAVADAQALQQGGFVKADSAGGSSGSEMSARLKDFLDATGFDPAEDVRKVYVAAPSGFAGSGSSSEAVPQLALAADFDRARFEEQLGGELGDRFEQSTHRGQSVYRSTRTGEEGRSLAFALTDGGLILLSDPQGVRRMLDRLDGDGSDSAGSDDRLMRLADRVRGRGDTWFVARNLADLSAGMGTGDNTGDADQRFQRLRKIIQHAAGAVSMTTGRTADGEVFLYTQEGAAPADLREVLEGLVSAAGRGDSLSARKRRALESIEIEETGDGAVRVGFSVPLDK